MRYLKLRDKKSTKLYCFSPPVMIATFIIEIILAAYVVYKYKMNSAIRLVVVMLVALAVFQISEYFVCTGPNGMVWSRIGYVAITALPPLGLHILNKISGHKNNIINLAAYTSMGLIMAYYILSPTVFSGYQCTGNYVIFQLTSNMSLMYSIYYYGWLLIAFIIGVKRIISKVPSKTQKNNIKLMLLGYLIFLIPTALVNTINPQTRSGIPSIMCGFAVFFALILALKIAPNLSEIARRIKIPFTDRNI